MSDFRLNCGFYTHPKTIKLRRRVGADGVLSLTQLWSWAALNRTDGRLTGMATEDIEIAAGWQGEDGVFVNACVELGWLDPGGEGATHTIHDWVDHQPYVSGAETRKKIARDAAAARWGNKSGAPDAQGMLGACNEHAKSNARGMQAASRDDAHRMDEQCPLPSPSPSPSGSLHISSSLSLPGQADGDEELEIFEFDSKGRKCTPISIWCTIMGSGVDPPVDGPRLASVWREVGGRRMYAEVLRQFLHSDILKKCPKVLVSKRCRKDFIGKAREILGCTAGP